MNKEELNERKELDNTLNDLYRYISTVNTFLRDKSKYYKTKESIEALKQIRSILANKEEEYENLKKRQHILKKSLVESCNHEIVFKDDLNTFCCLCRTLIIDIPDTTKVEIYLPGSWEDPLIHSNDEFNGKYLRTILIELACELLDDKDIDDILEKLEELQYHANIKTRRLKP